MRAAVVSLLEDPAARGRMAVRAAASVRGRDWGSVCDELIGHYQAVRPYSAGRDAA
jgi:hypothetical protein